MPRSFLIKRIEKVRTGYFPWQEDMIVQSCCLEYCIGESEKQDKEEENKMIEVVDSELEESTEDRDSIRSQSPTEIKILTPYQNTPPPPLIIYSNKATMYQHEDPNEDAHSKTSEDTESLIPSPLGCNDPTFIPYRQNHPKSPEPSAFQQYCRYPTMVSAHYPEGRYLTPWSTHHRHHQNLEDAKKHQCEYCLKWFQRSSSLSNHRLIHKNSKSYKCNQCNMSFLRKSDLGKHMVTHSGSKPYQCNVCGKRFSQSSNMLTHQRRHTGIRPYSCGICGKAFYRKVDVRRHASVHRNY